MDAQGGAAYNHHQYHPGLYHPQHQGFYQGHPLDNITNGTSREYPPPYQEPLSQEGRYTPERKKFCGESELNYYLGNGRDRGRDKGHHQSPTRGKPTRRSPPRYDRGETVTFYSKRSSGERQGRYTRNTDMINTRNESDCRDRRDVARDRRAANKERQERRSPKRMDHRATRYRGNSEEDYKTRVGRNSEGRRVPKSVISKRIRSPYESVSSDTLSDLDTNDAPKDDKYKNPEQRNSVRQAERSRRENESSSREKDGLIQEKEESKRGKERRHGEREPLDQQQDRNCYREKHIERDRHKNLNERDKHKKPDVRDDKKDFKHIDNRYGDVGIVIPQDTHTLHRNRKRKHHKEDSHHRTSKKRRSDENTEVNNNFENDSEERVVTVITSEEKELLTISITEKKTPTPSPTHSPRKRSNEDRNLKKMHEKENIDNSKDLEFLCNLRENIDRSKAERVLKFPVDNSEVSQSTFVELLGQKEVKDMPREKKHENNVNDESTISAEKVECGDTISTEAMENVITNDKATVVDEIIKNNGEEVLKEPTTRKGICQNKVNTDNTHKADSNTSIDSAIKDTQRDIEIRDTNDQEVLEDTGDNKDRANVCIEDSTTGIITGMNTQQLMLSECKFGQEEIGDSDSKTKPSNIDSENTEVRAESGHKPLDRKLLRTLSETLETVAKEFKIAAVVNDFLFKQKPVDTHFPASTSTETPTKSLEGDIGIDKNLEKKAEAGDETSLKDNIQNTGKSGHHSDQMKDYVKHREAKGMNRSDEIKTIRSTLHALANKDKVKDRLEEKGKTVNDTCEKENDNKVKRVDYCGDEGKKGCGVEKRNGDDKIVVNKDTHKKKDKKTSDDKVRGNCRGEEKERKVHKEKQIDHRVHKKVKTSHDKKVEKNGNDKKEEKVSQVKKGGKDSHTNNKQEKTSRSKEEENAGHDKKKYENVKKDYKEPKASHKKDKATKLGKEEKAHSHDKKECKDWNDKKQKVTHRKEGITTTNDIKKGGNVICYDKKKAVDGGGRKEKDKKEVKHCHSKVETKYNLVKKHDKDSQCKKEVKVTDEKKINKDNNRAEVKDCHEKKTVKDIQQRAKARDNSEIKPAKVYTNKKQVIQNQDEKVCESDCSTLVKTKYNKGEFRQKENIDNGADTELTTQAGGLKSSERIEKTDSIIKHNQRSPMVVLKRLSPEKLTLGRIKCANKMTESDGEESEMMTKETNEMEKGQIEGSNENGNIKRRRLGSNIFEAMKEITFQIDASLDKSPDENDFGRKTINENINATNEDLTNAKEIIETTKSDENSKLTINTQKTFLFNKNKKSESHIKCKDNDKVLNNLNMVKERLQTNVPKRKQSLNKSVAKKDIKKLFRSPPQFNKKTRVQHEPNQLDKKKTSSSAFRVFESKEIDFVAETNQLDNGIHHDCSTELPIDQPKVTTSAQGRTHQISVNEVGPETVNASQNASTNDSNTGSCTERNMKRSEDVPDHTTYPIDDFTRKNCDLNDFDDLDYDDIQIFDIGSDGVLEQTSESKTSETKTVKEDGPSMLEPTVEVKKDAPKDQKLSDVIPRSTLEIDSSTPQSSSNNNINPNPTPLLKTFGRDLIHTNEHSVLDKYISDEETKGEDVTKFCDDRCFIQNKQCHTKALQRNGNRQRFGVMMSQARHEFLSSPITVESFADTHTEQKEGNIDDDDDKNSSDDELNMNPFKVRKEKTSEGGKEDTRKNKISGESWLKVAKKNVKTLGLLSPESLKNSNKNNFNTRDIGKHPSENSKGSKEGMRDKIMEHLPTISELPNIAKEAYEKGFVVKHCKKLQDGELIVTQAHFCPRWLYVVPGIESKRLGKCMFCQSCRKYFTPVEFSMHHDDKGVSENINKAESRDMDYIINEITAPEGVKQIFKRFQRFFQDIRKTANPIRPHIPSTDSSKDIINSKVGKDSGNVAPLRELFPSMPVFKSLTGDGKMLTLPSRSPEHVVPASPIYFAKSANGTPMYSLLTKPLKSRLEDCANTANNNESSTSDIDRRTCPGSTKQMVEFEFSESSQENQDSGAVVGSLRDFQNECEDSVGKQETVHETNIALEDNIKSIETLDRESNSPSDKIGCEFLESVSANLVEEINCNQDITKADKQDSVDNKSATHTTTDVTEAYEVAKNENEVCVKVRIDTDERQMVPRVETVKGISENGESGPVEGVKKESKTPPRTEIQDITKVGQLIQDENSTSTGTENKEIDINSLEEFIDNHSAEDDEMVGKETDGKITGVGPLAAVKIEDLTTVLASSSNIKKGRSPTVQMVVDKKIDELCSLLCINTPSRRVNKFLLFNALQLECLRELLNKRKQRKK